MLSAMDAVGWNMHLNKRNTALYANDKGILIICQKATRILWIESNIKSLIKHRVYFWIKTTKNTDSFALAYIIMEMQGCLCKLRIHVQERSTGYSEMAMICWYCLQFGKCYPSLTLKLARLCWAWNISGYLCQWGAHDLATEVGVVVYSRWTGLCRGSAGQRYTCDYSSFIFYTNQLST